jgi:hypothetical protein
MGILDRLMGKGSAAGREYPAEYFPSVVMLLREPAFPSADEVLIKAQKAWGAGGRVERVATMREGASHVLRSASVIYSVHTDASRYGGSVEGGDEILMRPWNEHRAWMSIDMPNTRCEQLRRHGVLGDIYKVLLIYAFLSWSESSLGVYFPAEGVTVPSFGALAESIQWGRRNGLNLSFLN